MLWTAVITLDNPQPNGAYNQWTDLSGNVLSQPFGPAPTRATRPSTITAVGHAYVTQVDPQSYAFTAADNVVGARPRWPRRRRWTAPSAPAARCRTAVFSAGHGGRAAGERVTWDQRNTLCGSGYIFVPPATAAQWVANFMASVAPSTTTGSPTTSATAAPAPTTARPTPPTRGSAAPTIRCACAAPAPTPTATRCNWTGCGLNTTTDQYFGGCVGDSTAGTLCCLASAADDVRALYTQPQRWVHGPAAVLRARRGGVPGA